VTRMREMTNLLVRVLVVAFLFVNPVVTIADQAQYIYDDLGRLSQVIDGQGNVSTEAVSVSRIRSEMGR
jgi:uncharacterized protein RhaS with RHS repeats